MISALLSIISANVLYFILHIQNTSSFPKPLSAKEERRCLEQMANGDQNARAMLIEHNLRLVSHIIKKYYSRTNDTDDLISIGTIGLIKAIDSFDYKKNVRLATYASRCIETDKDGNPLTIEDTLSDSTDMAAELEKKTQWQKVAKYIENMDDERSREIIILRYGLRGEAPLTQREVAEKLGISRSYVSRIEKKIIEDIRDKYK